MRINDYEDFPVKIHCPIRDTEETVYFPIIEKDGKEYLDINLFNGCDIGFCDCHECAECKHIAYEKIFSRA